MTDNEPYTPADSTMKETRNFHPADRILRKHGFRILSRPRSGPTLWIRHGQVMQQESAELVAANEKRKE